MNNICGIASLINNYKSGTAPLWLHQSIITKAALLLDSTIILNCCMNNICGIASLINNYKSGTAPLWLHQSIITKAALLLDSTINLNCCMNNICGFASLINHYKSGTAPLWLHQSIITKAALLLYDGDLKLDYVAFVFVTSFFRYFWWYPSINCVPVPHLLFLGLPSVSNAKLLIKTLSHFSVPKITALQHL